MREGEYQALVAAHHLGATLARAKKIPPLRKLLPRKVTPGRVKPKSASELMAIAALWTAAAQ